MLWFALLWCVMMWCGVVSLVWCGVLWYGVVYGIREAFKLGFTRCGLNVKEV